MLAREIFYRKDNTMMEMLEQKKVKSPWYMKLQEDMKMARIKGENELVDLKREGRLNSRIKRSFKKLSKNS